MVKKNISRSKKKSPPRSDRSTAWQVLAAIGPKRFVVNERQLSVLSHAVLHYAQKHCHKGYLPPASVSTLSVVICNDREIQKLNKFYRHKDKPTDVLSFSQIEGIEGMFSGEILGDVVISAPTMMRQAREYKVTPFEELCRLLVHGVLHLFGYDHENVSRAERLKMERLEDKIRQILSQS